MTQLANTMFHPRLVAARQPRKLALVFADTGESLTYAQLVENADRAARLFADLGLREGDTIALFLENHLRFAELCWAAKNSGITYACISSQASSEDAAYILENSDAKLLVSSAHLADVACEVALKHNSKQSGQPCHYLMVDGEQGPFASYDSLIAQTPAEAPSGRRRGPSMLYSSGTTGRPKGVPPRCLAGAAANAATVTDTALRVE